MLSRVLVDIYHLKRVHMVVHDKNLADILKSKICRLNLKPAVAELHRQQARDLASRGAVASAAAAARKEGRDGRRRRAGVDHVMPSSTRGDALDHTFAPNDAASATLPDPPSIGFLLECIAYFDLADADITLDALELAKAALPFMSSTLACTTLAACCALSHEQVADKVMPLLLESLGEPLEAGHTGAVRTHHGLLHSGSITLRFIEALRRVGVAREEVWCAVGAHCVRCLDALDGQEVVHLVELLYEQQMLCYPALYTAVEAHVATKMQPHRVPYLSTAQVQQLLFYYTELGLPTTVLRQVTLETYEGRGFDSALDTAATQSDLMAPRPHASLFTARQRRAENRPTTHAQVRTPAHTTEVTSKEATAPPSTLSLPVVADAALHVQQEQQKQQQQQQLDAFLAHVSKLLLHADSQELVELLGKCAAKHVMHATLMEAAVARVEQLYFPQGINVASVQDDEGGGSSTRAALLPTPLQTEQGQQLLLSTLTLLLRFEDPRFFAACRQAVADMLNRMASEAAVLSLSNLSLAYGACTLLPPPASAARDTQGHPPLRQSLSSSTGTAPEPRSSPDAPYRPPTRFFEAVMTQLKRTRDVTAHENHARLLQLVRTLLALAPLDGRTVLVQHLPSITIAATNVPRAVQVELLAALADFPEAADSLVPTLLRALGPVRDQPTWYRAMSAGEVRVLLDALVCSRALSGGLRPASALHAAGDTAEGGGRHAGATTPTADRATSVDATTTTTTTPPSVCPNNDSAATAAAALIGGIVAFIKEQKARFQPSDLTHHLHTLAILGYRELDFFVSTAEHLLNVAVYSETSAHRRARGGGVVPAAGHAPTSVHDLSVLLYVFTYLLRGVIRVTQQLMARLKVSVSLASPRDVSLILYSLVRLHVARPRELSVPLCERAAVVFADFTAAELASVWSSLRVLGEAPDAFLTATTALLSGRVDPPSSCQLTAHQRLSITAAVVAVTQRAHPPPPAAMLAATASAHPGSLADRLTLASHPLLQPAAAPALTASPGLFSCAHALADDRAAQTALRTAAVRVAGTRQLSGLALSLAVTTLAAMPLAPLRVDAWCLFAVQADRLCACLGTTDVAAEGSASGGVGAGVDAATAHTLGAAEVLVALVQLYASMDAADHVAASTAAAGASASRGLAAVAHWVRAPAETTAHAPSACPLPPRLLRYLSERQAALTAAPLLRDRVRPLLAIHEGRHHNAQSTPEPRPAVASVVKARKGRPKKTKRAPMPAAIPIREEAVREEDESVDLDQGDVMTF